LANVAVTSTSVMFASEDERVLETVVGAHGTGPGTLI